MQIMARRPFDMRLALHCHGPCVQTGITVVVSHRKCELAVQSSDPRESYPGEERRGATPQSSSFECMHEMWSKYSPPLLDFGQPRELSAQATGSLSESYQPLPSSTFHVIRMGTADKFAQRDDLKACTSIRPCDTKTAYGLSRHSRPNVVTTLSLSRYFLGPRRIPRQEVSHCTILADLRGAAKASPRKHIRPAGRNSTDDTFASSESTSQAPGTVRPV
ncbi:hypothetical protein FB567DRAFT_620066 [Paraphoma chrysanthemicola]|uniref:Uncharacterized protein n=1 Tax=Paraphoma chrysanthemicola TaxID=798071 RepID=A0A8K0W065_9PLEO|nr:hypothetical protein FB567DRAFT_620066 [Paraphoma chrysanthemicola]